VLRDARRTCKAFQKNFYFGINPSANCLHPAAWLLVFSGPEEPLCFSVVSAICKTL
jgi:hypothetical protein